VAKHTSSALVVVVGIVSLPSSSLIVSCPTASSVASWINAASSWAWAGQTWTRRRSARRRRGNIRNEEEAHPCRRFEEGVGIVAVSCVVCGVVWVFEM